MRRSGRGDSAAKEVGIEDKARWRESDVAHVPERGSSWATPCFSRFLRHAQYGESILSQTPRGLRWIEVEDSRRRSRRGHSAGKEVGIEDKSQVEKEMSPCPDERQSIGDNLP
ncbi:hypothetical protein PoB_005794400 [Plakobranchus ocellatus]|uniref:Uncharacterized protein n=1 Tax=Plakobranchus ocellatus TaxID=259542 RepID=A0AAV4CKJ7_9GAST|nr:hypothetical protein PoB_005794400 [Plakobranchus ocellatus]